MKDQNLSRIEERGNVLFLILIAVALFAALSYAVTQSTRSGSGSTDREQSILSGASMTQYPTALRTAVIRMVLGGVDVTQLEFNSPANFGSLTTLEQGVFNNSGGGALFQQAPAEFMTGTIPGDWFFNLNFHVPELGTTPAITDPSGNELTAFLPGISTGICVQVNREFNIDTTGCTMVGGVPTIDVTDANVAEIDDLMDEAYTLPTDAEVLAGTACTGTGFSGQASGCFHDAAGARNVFYSVLLER